MVRRPSRCLGIDTDEPELRQIQLVDEDVDHANRIILANPIFQAFRKERALSAIRAFNEALHQIPPRIRAGIITRESLLSERFYTAWVISLGGDRGRGPVYVRSTSNRVEILCTAVKDAKVES